MKASPLQSLSELEAVGSIRFKALDNRMFSHMVAGSLSSLLAHFRFQIDIFSVMLLSSYFTVKDILIDKLKEFLAKSIYIMNACSRI